MKIRQSFMAVLAIATLASCSNEREDHLKLGSNADVAFLSIQIDTQKGTRASGEDEGTESTLKTLYLVTFDDNNIVVPVPGSGGYFIKIDPASSSPDPVKVSAKAKKLLVIANPGTEMLKVITAVNQNSAFHTINAAISNVTESELIAPASGYTMINSGLEAGKSAGDKITDPLVSLVGKIHIVDENTSEQDAKDGAAADPVEITIERLVSKLAFKLKSTIASPKGTFTFEKWTIDAVNTEFFPFAEKTLLSVSHSAGGVYKYNFYTQDPNFSGTVGAGLKKGTVDPVTYEPILPTSYGWLGANSTESVLAYCVENTMDASYQQYGNATRLVIKGQYYPTEVEKTSGDWFEFAGLYYKDLTMLQTAYAAAQDNSPLKVACDGFYGKVYQYLVDNGEDVTGLTGFGDLTTNILAAVNNGGQVVKNGTNPVIRWFQNGLNYWYYEIRHDNGPITDMSFGKYGVVRNNWYSITLGSVDGAGTPWYPEIDDPGIGDPDPNDPIDESSGYLGISITTAPWIIWENEIGI